MQDDTSEYIPGEKALRLMQIIQELGPRAYGYPIYLKLLEFYPTIQLVDVYEIIVDLVIEDFLTTSTEGRGDGHRKLYIVNSEKTRG